MKFSELVLKLIYYQLWQKIIVFKINFPEEPKKYTANQKKVWILLQF